MLGERSYLAELKVVGVLDGGHGRARLHSRGAGRHGLHPGEASAAEGCLRADRDAGRDGRRAEHRHSHRLSHC